ncbi:MAG: hypothetical protein LBQ67_00590 [Treponema sp.]|jgi:hypothetical protein|nr:hypothetical protein [Treponema sp.]
MERYLQYEKNEEKNHIATPRNTKVFVRNFAFSFLCALLIDRASGLLCAFAVFPSKKISMRLSCAKNASFQNVTESP